MIFGILTVLSMTLNLYLIQSVDLSSYQTAAYGALPEVVRSFDWENFFVINSPPAAAAAASTTLEGAQQQTGSRRFYLKYDQAGLQPIPGTARSHHLPNAVPEARTIPRHLVENKAYHISQRTNTTTQSVVRPVKEKGGFNWKHHNYESDYRTIYLFNPAILPLHNTIPTNNDDPDCLSKKDLQALTGGDPSVRYVAVYDAYLGSNCFGPDPKREIMKAGELISYTAVALLDERLDVIPGSDILIDINAGPGYGKYWRQWRGDCRIFLMRGTIYFSCNEFLHPMRIRRTKTADGRPIESVFDTTTFGTRSDDRTPYVYSNIYGSGLEITLTHRPHRSGRGKNFQFFRSKTASESTEGKYHYYIQTYPAPHTFRRVNIPPAGDPLNLYPRDWKSEETFSSAILPPLSFDTPDTNNTILTCLRENDTRTKKEIDWFTCTDPREVPFFHTREHGTACCVSVNLDGRDVLVGISHEKLSPASNFWLIDRDKRYEHFGKDQFVSRFLAYNPSPPFDIVASSGWFCLGFADVEEKGGSTQAGRNTQYRLNLFNDTYDCPAIHFITGFSEVVGDSSKAILSYGVNDCHPRMMVVEVLVPVLLLLEQPARHQQRVVERERKLLRPLRLHHRHRVVFL